ncbi:MaoC/PaaZ C-terminal domain-containing protein [Streptomyces sp. NPDC057116]|uniref:MaoC/PaaZ C-terminal domain-containing protein n=1 Tax=Streptomyces sp. NPDC057116 TaxID=3346023 RepID=UPI003631A999
MTTAPGATRTDRRTASTAEIAAYRAAARTGLPPAADAQPSPVHAFVLAHTAADRTVRSLIGGEEASVVHLGQDIRLERPVRPGEPVTIAVDVLGARREPRGTRVAVRTRLTGADGAVPFAELVTGALLVGASGIEPFGDIPSGAAPAPDGPAGEPATATHRPTTDGIRAYAHASGDLNPIHLDPETARAAGFDGVIAHGMSVVALVCEEIADRYADGDITRLTALGCRFSGPVLPDEPLDITLQPDAGPTVVRFTCRTPKGPAVKAGWARLSPASKERTS